MSAKTRNRKRRSTKHHAPAVDPAPTPSLPPIDSAAWNLLADEAGFLRDAIDRSQPEAAKLFPLLDLATGYEPTLPPAFVLTAALDAFHELPPDARRRLLRGWTMERWPAGGDVVADQTHQPVLVVSAGKRRCNGAAVAEHRLVRDDAVTPVRLHVRFGTAKREALQAVWDLWHVIETQWPTLTVMDPAAPAVLDQPLPVAEAEAAKLAPPTTSVSSPPPPSVLSTPLPQRKREPLQRVFQRAAGWPVPRLPREPDGTPRIADGKRYLSATQMAKESDDTPDGPATFARLWDAALGELLSEDDRIAIGRAD